MWREWSTHSEHLGGSSPTKSDPLGLAEPGHILRREDWGTEIGVNSKEKTEGLKDPLSLSYDLANRMEKEITLSQALGNGQDSLHRLFI